MRFLLLGEQGGAFLEGVQRRVPRHRGDPASAAPRNHFPPSLVSLPSHPHAHTSNYNNPTRTPTSSCKVEPLDGVSQWYRALWRGAGFRRRAAERWRALRLEALSDAWIASEIANVSALIAGASDRNYARWQARLARPEFGAAQGGWRAQFANATAELQSWLFAHTAWLDGAFAKLEAPGAGPTAYLEPAGAVAGGGAGGAGGAGGGAAAALPSTAAAAAAAPAAGLPGAAAGGRGSGGDGTAAVVAAARGQ